MAWTIALLVYVAVQFVAFFLVLVATPIDMFWFRNQTAEGFAVISVFVYGAAFVLGVIMLFCYRWLRWVCLALNSIGAVTVCIVWVSMAVTYNRDEGPDCQPIKATFTYGAGFVLFLVAWLLDLFNIPVLLLLPQDSDSAESGKETENKAQE